MSEAFDRRDEATLARAHAVLVHHRDLAIEADFLDADGDLVGARHEVDALLHAVEAGGGQLHAPGAGLELVERQRRVADELAIDEHGCAGDVRFKGKHRKRRSRRRCRTLATRLMENLG